MKKTFSLIIIGVLFAGVIFSGCKNVDNTAGTITKTPLKPNYSKYTALAENLKASADSHKAYLEKNVKKSSAKAKFIKNEIAENFYGFTCDFDNNGTKEILLYSYNNKPENPENIYSVYTLKNNQPKIIASKKKNYISYVGKERGCVGIVSKNGKNYIFEVKSTSPTDFSEVRRTYDYKIYGVKNNELKKLRTARWVEVNTDVGKKYHKEFPQALTKSQYKIDGKKVAKNKFVSYFNSFKFTNLKKTASVEKDGFYITSTAANPNKLLKQVKNMK